MISDLPRNNFSQHSNGKFNIIQEMTDGSSEIFRLRLLFIDPFGMTPARKLDFQQLTSRERGIKLNIESKQ